MLTWHRISKFSISYDDMNNATSKICRIHPNALEYTSFGKPNALVFQNAETVLKQLVSSLHPNAHDVNQANPGSHHFKTLYMVGDNPSVDIKGAHQVCLTWIINIDSYFCVNDMNNLFRFRYLT